MVDEATALEVDRVSVSFQGLVALRDVSLAFGPGEIVGLIGPNGAGKTTFVNVITGFQKPDSGRVRLGGRDLDGTTPDARARLGIARTFQGVLPFANLSVTENVEAGAVARGLGRAEARRRAAAILERLNLAGQAHRRAGTLPFGDERRVGIGRAIAMAPRFLLMDEPAAGLNDTECAALEGVVRGIRADLNCGILLIEHRMSVVFALCDRILVLQQGRTIAAGTPAAVRTDPVVRRAYLGDAIA
jgi:branched-chain amino acid transport system ATP-binding protein